MICVSCGKSFNKVSDLNGMCALYDADTKKSKVIKTCDECYKKRMNEFPDIYWQTGHMTQEIIKRRLYYNAGIGSKPETKADF